MDGLMPSSLAATWTPRGSLDRAKLHNLMDILWPLTLDLPTLPSLFNWITVGAHALLQDRRLPL